MGQDGCYTYSFGSYYSCSSNNRFGRSIIFDKVPTISTYFGTTVEEALISWAHSIAPEDMYGRFEQPYELHWDPSKVQLNDIDFRRWLLALITKPVESNVMRDSEWKLELLVEGKTPVTKRKSRITFLKGRWFLI